MQRHTPLRLHENSVEKEPNPIVAALEKSGDEHQLYAASVNFLNKRLQEKCRNPTLRQKTTQSCYDLTTIDSVMPELRKTQSKVKFGFDSPTETQFSLDMNKVLPFPKPKSTKTSFLTRLTNSFRKCRRCFNAAVDTETDDNEILKNCSGFKFPRCERLNKCIDPLSLFNITEELSRTSIKEISNQVVDGNSKGDF